MRLVIGKALLERSSRPRLRKRHAIDSQDPASRSCVAVQAFIFMILRQIQLFQPPRKLRSAADGMTIQWCSSSRLTVSRAIRAHRVLLQLSFNGCIQHKVRTVVVAKRHCLSLHRQSAQLNRHFHALVRHARNSSATASSASAPLRLQYLHYRFVR